MSDNDTAFTILVPVGEAAHLTILLAVAAPLARKRAGHVVPLHVSLGGERPDWLQVPEEDADVTDEPVVLQGDDIGDTLLEHAADLRPDLLLLYWDGEASRGRALLGRKLDPLVQYPPSDVAVLRVDEAPDAFANRMRTPKILIPLGKEPQASLAAAIALDLSPDAQITVLRVASPDAGGAAIAAELQNLRSMLQNTAAPARLEPHVVLNAVVDDGIEAAAEGYDLVLIEATHESFLDRLFFGSTPQRVARGLEVPLLIVRRKKSAVTEAVRRVRWRLIDLLKQLSGEERIRVYRQVRRSARIDPDYTVMMLLSAGIASLGLLRDSTVVIIGAMLVAPLVAPLLGVSMGIAQGDARLLRLSLRTLALGLLVVLAVSALAEVITPFYEPSDEMLARTEPSLLDLGIALISGAAAAYASGRDEADLAAALSGVAIAVALVPPLATLGLMATAQRIEGALGSLLLVLTNLVGIVAAATVIYLWMGFRPNTVVEKRARTFRGSLTMTVVVAALVTGALGILWARALNEAHIRRQVSEVLEDREMRFGSNARVSEWEVDLQPDLTVSLLVEATGDVARDELFALQQAINERLDEPAALQVTVLEIQRMSTDRPPE